MTRPLFKKPTLNHLSTRELQAYGAACLAKFCADKCIFSQHVERLLAHLLSLLSCEHLPAWEAAGARLVLTGRGDGLPRDLRERVKPDLVEIFEQLVELVVEIGLIDMYGAE